MDTTEFFVQFLVTAAVGGLIGIEREHRSDGQDVIAGVRTFPLISIAGYLSGLLAVEQGSPWVLAAGVAGAFGFAFTFVFMRSRMGQYGATTPIAIVVTFLLGAFIAYGHTFEAVVVGVVATFLLVTKRRLHGFAKYLDDEEILSALQFITVLFILVPLTATLTPDRTGFAWLGRGALVDPYAILLLVVFVSAMSFVSLLAMRQVGPHRGMEFSGLLGGLVNSEATAAGLAERAKMDDALEKSALVAILLATGTMVLRTLAIAGFADSSLVLLRALLPFAIPLAVLAFLLAWRARAGRREPVDALRVANPFAVGPALKFALVYAAVSVLVQGAILYTGPAAVYLTALGGFVSAGAVVGSLAALTATGTIPLGVALPAALLTFAAGILNKILIVRAVNAPMVRRLVRPLGILGAGAILGALAAFAFA